MNKTVYSLLLSAALSAASCSFTALASAVEDPLTQVSTGKHSFRDLGDNYSVEVPLEHIKGARLVLLDEELAAFIGFNADNRKELEQRIHKTFALRTSTNARARQVGFATRYRDGAIPNAPLSMPYPDGDGRVVWLGSFTHKFENGHEAELDVTLKGAGRTPLARPVPFDPKYQMLVDWRQYGDGLQTMSEAVRSFIATQALSANNCSTLADLAVFELPSLKLDPLTKRWERAALTVRIGIQFRPAHLACFARRPIEIRPLVDYLIRKNLNISDTTKITADHLETYLSEFARSLGTHAADLDDLHFIHGSLTKSNLTLTGHIMDYGTLLTPDVAHAEYKDSRGQQNFGVQVYQLRLNLLYLLRSLEVSGYGWVKSLEADLVNKFDRSYLAETLMKRAKRLGTGVFYDSPSDKNYWARFYEVTEKIAAAKSPRRTNYYGQDIYPSAFDLNAILKGSLKIFKLPADQQPAAWIKLFIPTQSWSTTKAEDLAVGSEFHAIVSEYIAVISAFADEYVKTGISLDQAITNAAAIGRPTKSEALFPDYSNVLREVRNTWSNPARNTALALKVAASLVEYRSCDQALAK